jgi:hypothetical protein
LTYILIFYNPRMQNNFAKLPQDVIINHIAPFMYRPQRRELLQDIMDYRESENILMYMTRNDRDLIRELFRFCNLTAKYHYIIGLRFRLILQRMFLLSNMKILDVHQHIYKHYYVKQHMNTRRKIRSLIGLLTPIERTQLINRMLIR